MAAPGTLHGCSVIVTRPEEQAEALARPLRERGAHVRVRPLVRIAPPADGGAALRDALARVRDYDWIVFTSANAVRACAAAPRPAAWPRVACVGTATAREAATLGLRDPVLPETFTGAALADAMRRSASLTGARVLWPRASGAGEALREGLLAAGAAVHCVDAYTTVEDAAAAEALCRELRQERCDVIAFTSPSAVRAFATGRSEDCTAAVAVIGTVTRDAVHSARLDVGVLPARHTVDGLVAALEQWWKTRR